MLLYTRETERQEGKWDQAWQHKTQSLYTLFCPVFVRSLSLSLSLSTSSSENLCSHSRPVMKKKWQSSSLCVNSSREVTSYLLFQENREPCDLNVTFPLLWDWILISLSLRHSSEWLGRLCNTFSWKSLSSSSWSLRRTVWEESVKLSTP